jgi:hypothetical protein
MKVTYMNRAEVAQQVFSLLDEYVFDLMKPEQLSGLVLQPQPFPKSPVFADSRSITLLVGNDEVTRKIVIPFGSDVVLSEEKGTLVCHCPGAEKDIHMRRTFRLLRSDDVELYQFNFTLSHVRLMRHLQNHHPELETMTDVVHFLLDMPTPVFEFKAEMDATKQQIFLAPLSAQQQRHLHELVQERKGSPELILFWLLLKAVEVKGQ